jgi:hypothetical protein
MQVDRSSSDGKAAGEQASKAIASFIRLAATPTLKQNVTWVETVDGTGTHIAQNPG